MTTVSLKKTTFEERTKFALRIRTDTCAQRGNNNEIIALSKQPSRHFYQQTEKKSNKFGIAQMRIARAYENASKVVHVH